MQKPSDLTIRPLRPDDMPAMLDMWVATWQTAYPSIDFKARRGWAKDHFAALERDGAQSRVAVENGGIVGAIVVHPQTGYLDQLVVATDAQGRGVASLLVAEARRLSPRLLELHVNRDNAGAIAFYLRSGFVVTGEETNPRSGAPIYRMRWTPET